MVDRFRSVGTAKHASVPWNMMQSRHHAGHLVSSDQSYVALGDPKPAKAFRTLPRHFGDWRLGIRNLTAAYYCWNLNYKVVTLRYIRYLLFIAYRAVSSVGAEPKSLFYFFTLGIVWNFKHLQTTPTCMLTVNKGTTVQCRKVFCFLALIYLIYFFPFFQAIWNH